MRRPVLRRPIAWGDLDARARGLSTRLLPRERLKRLAAAPDERERVREARAALSGAEGAGDLERMARQAAAASLARLARWAGHRTRVLPVLFEDEDRRSVGALLRGAAQGAGPEERLAGLVPTPTLPEGTLVDLARRPTVEAVLEGLVAAPHPWGTGLATGPARGAGDLFALGLEVDRLFARRAVRAARRGGPRLWSYARRTVDLLNVWSVLLAERWLPAAPPTGVFLEGGEALDREGFTRLVAAGPVERRRELAARLAGPVGAVLGDPSIELSALEARVLRARIAEERRAALLEPLGPAPVLLYALRLRAQVVDLSRIGWGAALAADRATITRELVTA